MGAAISPDGKTLFTACSDGTARLWDAATGQQKCAPLQHKSSVLGLALSPDGKTLLTGCADGMAHLWDVWRRTPRVPPFRLRAADVNMWYMAFSPDGKLVVTPSSDGIPLRDAATVRPRGPAVRIPGEFRSAALEPQRKGPFDREW